MIRGLAIKLVGKKRREKIKKENIKRVLIGGGRIGDIVVKTPMLEALSKLNEDVKIDITVAKGAKCLVENIPYINEVIEIDEKPTRNKIVKGYRQIKGALRDRKKYDLYFDFTNNCRFIHTLSLKLMAPKYLIGRYRLEKFGIKKDELTLFDSYIDVKDDAHAVDINMDYLKPLGLHKESKKYKLYLGKNERKYENYFEKDKVNIVLNHRASSEPRSLTLEQLKDLSLKLINLNKDIVVYIISLPSEYKILKELVDNLNIKNIKLLPKTKGIGEAAGLLKYSDMLVSVDTGLIHIASVYNIPIVGIYPLTENSAKLFEPKSERYEIVRGTKSGYTIEGVSLDKVVESVNKILEESVYDKRCVV